jgi:hypothetical protein
MSTIKPLAPQPVNKISAVLPFQKKRRRVLGRDMAYVEAGEGNPSYFCTAIQPRPTSGATCCRTCGHEAAASPRT